VTDFQPIVSSNLESAKFADGEMTMRFKSGKQYLYIDFETGLWKKFKKLFDGKAGSAGSFFAKYIRSLPCKQLDDWK
jgi:hypothetical protein